MIIRKPRDPFFQMIHAQEYVYPVSEQGFIPHADEWETMRNAIDKFYAYCTESEIIEYNEEVQLTFNREREEYLAQSEMESKVPAKRSGYIYLIEGLDTKWYKIGQSKSPKIRLRQLGTLVPFEIISVKTHLVADMDLAESYWHERLAAKRVNGEWFALDAVDVTEFCLWKAGSL